MRRRKKRTQSLLLSIPTYRPKVPVLPEQASPACRNALRLDHAAPEGDIPLTARPSRATVVSLRPRAGGAYDNHCTTEIAGALGGAAAWPLAARAQREEIRRVGLLMGLEADNPEGQSELKVLRQAFQELGRVDGRNLQLEISWSGGEPDRIQASARELVDACLHQLMQRRRH